MLKHLIESQITRWANPGGYLPIQLDITNSCNLSCSHCYHSHHNNEGAISLDQWFSIIDQYESLIWRTSFRPFVFLCGGEPLLSPYLQPILKRLSRNRRNRIGILTNGLLASRLHPSSTEMFQKFDIQVSLDGWDSYSHAAVRGKGTFERTLAGIDIFIRNGFSVHLLAVLSRANQKQINKFFSLAKSLGVSSMNFTRLIVEGNAKKLCLSGADAPLGPFELKSAYRTIAQGSAEFGVRSNLTAPLFQLLNPLLGGSGLFSQGLVVDFKGNLLASSRSRIVLGNALQDGLSDVFFNHPILRNIRAGNVDVCGSCKFYAVCGGDRNAAYAATGNYLGADPGCWYDL